MARRGSGSGGGGMVGGGGMIQPVISIATGLLIFTILQIFAPTIGGTISDAQPRLHETCIVKNAADNDVYRTCTGNLFENVTVWSEWNSTHRVEIGLDAVPSGAETWILNIRILGVVILIISVAIAIHYVKGM